MLHRLTEAGLLKSRGRQRTDATHVLASVCTLSRLELVGESLRAALEQLTQADPDWLLPLVEPEWDDCYGRKVEIGRVPGEKAGVTALAEAFGRDGQRILAAAGAADAPTRLRTLTQVEILRRVWVHHCYWDARGLLRWRNSHALPPASLRFDSPYNTDAHYYVKRDTVWSGTDPVVARELACLRRRAETDPVSRGWVAQRAQELADVLCRDSLRRGDVLAFVGQCASGAELREFCFCARLADM